MVAIYERQRVGGQAKHYEVVVLKEGKEWVAGGVTIQASELYPSSEQWGVLGYTYPDLAGAERRYATLTGGKRLLASTSQEV